MCSGGFIVRAKSLKEKLRLSIETESISNYYRSNQIFWTVLFFLNMQNIGLDYECEIFQSFSCELDMKFIDSNKNNQNFNLYLDQK